MSDNLKQTYQNFIKNILGFSLASYIGAILSLVSVPITTRLFLPAEIGKINLFLSCSNIILVFCNMGFEQAFVRYFNETIDGYRTSSLAGLCLSISMAFLFVISIITMLFYEKVALVISGNINVFISVCLIVVLFSRVILQYTTLISRMSQNVVLYSFQAIFLVILTKLIYIFAAFINPSYKTAIIIMTISSLIVSIVFFILFCHKKLLSFPPYITKKLLLNMSKYSLPLVPTFFISATSMYLSQFMLRKYIGFAAIGIYTNAVTVAGVLSLVQSGFNCYWPAYVYANYKTETHIIQQTHHFVTFIIIAAALAMITVQDILYLFVGETFRSSKTIFPILIVIPVIYTIAETTRIGIRIAQKTYYDLIISAIVLISNYSLCIILIPIYNITGAALSSTISSILGLFITTYIGNRYYISVDNFLPMSCGIIILFCASFVNFIQNIYFKNSMLIILIILLFTVYNKQLLSIINYIKFYLKKHCCY